MRLRYDAVACRFTLQDGRQCGRMADHAAPRLLPLCHRHWEQLVDRAKDEVVRAAQMSTAASSIAWARHTDLHHLSPVVYFVRAGDAVKVGTAVSVDARLRAIRTGRAALTPEGLDVSGATVYATMPGGRALEARFHRLLRGHRIAGEWFRWSPRVQQLIDEWLETDALQGLPAITRAGNRYIACLPADASGKRRRVAAPTPGEVAARLLELEQAGVEVRLRRGPRRGAA